MTIGFRVCYDANDTPSFRAVDDTEECPRQPPTKVVAKVQTAVPARQSCGVCTRHCGDDVARVCTNYCTEIAVKL